MVNRERSREKERKRDIMLKASRPSPEKSLTADFVLPLVAANSSLKSKFTTYASAARWVSTNGLRLLLQFWYARTALFRLPAGGWVPGWVEWVVGFPRAARGPGATAGVSVQVWGWVCVVVVGLVGEAVAWGVERLLVVLGGKGKEKGMKMGGGGVYGTTHEPKEKKEESMANASS
jgi:CHD5-like protein